MFNVNFPFSAFLNRDAFPFLNHKRIERLWRQEGLKVTQRQPKRRRLSLTDGSSKRSKVSPAQNRGSAT